MGIFATILNKILHHSDPTASAAGTAQSPQTTAASSASGSPAGQAAQASASAPAASAPLQAVDVDAVLSKLAAGKGGGGNWRTSIVDLLKLLDLDSSLAARKELAAELNVRAGADGTAEQNIALQKAVMAKLAENGGKVPESLRH